MSDSFEIKKEKKTKTADNKSIFWEPSNLRLADEWMKWRKICQRNFQNGKENTKINRVTIVFSLRSRSMLISVIGLWLHKGFAASQQ